MHAIYQILLAPVIAAAVVVLAGKRPLPATLLSVLPTLIDVVGVIAFGLSVAIYGF